MQDASSQVIAGSRDGLGRLTGGDDVITSFYARHGTAGPTVPSEAAQRCAERAGERVPGGRTYDATIGEFATITNGIYCTATRHA